MQCLRHYCNILSLVNLQVGDRLPERRRRCDNAWMTGLSLALANLKPGTGKTTSAVWLAHIFAQAGNSVLLVDADPSGSALEWSDLAAMDPHLAAPEAAFPFRIVALPSRELHPRVPEIAQADDVVIIATPQPEHPPRTAPAASRGVLPAGAPARRPRTRYTPTRCPRAPRPELYRHRRPGPNPAAGTPDVPRASPADAVRAMIRVAAENPNDVPARLRRDRD